jgi:hypothetical protein
MVIKKYNFIKISKKSGYVYAVNGLTFEEVDLKNKDISQD